MIAIDARSNAKRANLDDLFSIRDGAATWPITWPDDSAIKRREITPSGQSVTDRLCRPALGPASRWNAGRRLPTRGCARTTIVSDRMQNVPQSRVTPLNGNSRQEDLRSLHQDFDSVLQSVNSHKRTRRASLFLG